MYRRYNCQKCGSQSGSLFDPGSRDRQQRRLSEASGQAGRRAMSHGWMMTRRTALRGLGTAMALPLLDTMLPSLSAAPAAAGKPAVPLRMAFVYVPNGKNMSAWTPRSEGEGFELTPTLEPLANVKSDLCVLSGLTQQTAFANGDGPGDHARALASFLTGRQARKTAG